MKNIIRTTSTLALAGLLLAACSGGGDDGVDTPFNAAAAWSNLVAPSAVRTITAAGRGNDGVDYAIELRFTSLGASTYPRSGAAATRSDQRISISANGGAPFIGVQSLYYTGGTQLIGASADDGSCSDIVTTLPPASALLGGSGALYTSTDYATCASSDTTVVSRSTATWSIESRSSVVYFCVNFSYRDASNNPAGTESDCVEVNANGSLGTRVRLTLTDPSGFSLVATGG